MQDVGIAVTAFGDKQIRELGFTDSTDIVAMTPGLIYTTPECRIERHQFLPARRRAERLRRRKREPGRGVRRRGLPPGVRRLELPAVRSGACRGAARAAGDAVRPQHDRRPGPLHQQAADRRARRLRRPVTRPVRADQGGSGDRRPDRRHGLRPPVRRDEQARRLDREPVRGRARLQRGRLAARFAPSCSGSRRMRPGSCFRATIPTTTRRSARGSTRRPRSARTARAYRSGPTSRAMR